MRPAYTHGTCTNISLVRNRPINETVSTMLGQDRENAKTNRNEQEQKSHASFFHADKGSTMIIERIALVVLHNCGLSADLVRI